MHTYRKRTLTVLNSLLFVFLAVFIFAYIQFRRQIPILNSGLTYYVEDMLIILLSLASIAKIVYEIHKVEHHHELEERISSKNNKKKPKKK